MSLLPHVAFAIVAISFAVRDILWLRSLAIAASLVTVGYEFLLWGVHEQYRMATITWHALFAGINTYQVWVLVYGERHVTLDEDEQLLLDGPFRGLTRLEFAKLRRLATWRNVPEGSILAREGEPLPELIVVFSGLADVEVDGHAKSTVRTGQLVGEMSFVAGGTASATVRATTPMRLLVWTKSELQRLMQRNPSLDYALTAIMGRDMSFKLRE